MLNSKTQCYITLGISTLMLTSAVFGIASPNERLNDEDNGLLATIASATNVAIALFALVGAYGWFQSFLKLKAYYGLPEAQKANAPNSIGGTWISFVLSAGMFVSAAMIGILALLVTGDDTTSTAIQSTLDADVNTLDSKYRPN